MAAEASATHAHTSDSRTTDIVQAVATMMGVIGFNKKAFEELCEGPVTKRGQQALTVTQLMLADAGGKIYFRFNELTASRLFSLNI